MRDDLEEALSKIKDHIASAQTSEIWPLSEADTERIAIEPILSVLGYGVLDYSKRPAGPGGDFPDYIVLPDRAERWILEAKEWGLRLDLRAARQALNYAHNRGARWAVLTNGREWRLYSAEARGGLDDGPTYCAQDILERREDAAGVLALLARESVLGGELDQKLRNQEIAAALRAALVEPPPAVLRELRRALGKRLDRDISRDDVFQALADVIAQPRAELVPQSAATVPPVAAVPATAEGKSWCALPELTRYEGPGHSASPEKVRLPDGQIADVKYWADVSGIVVRWLCTSFGIPEMPFRASAGAKNCFLNTAPNHGDGREMRLARKIDVAGTPVWIDVNRGAAQNCGALASLCADRSVDPFSIRIKLLR